MRIVVHVVTIIVSIAVVLSLSAAHFQRDRRRLLAEFESNTIDAAHDARHTLLTRLTAIGRDTQLLVNLVENTRRDARLDRTTQDRVIHSAFDALVAVVVPYRTVMLFDREGSCSAESVDPTEDRSQTEVALTGASRTLALAAIRSAQLMMSGPVLIGGHRPFYLYAFPAGPREAIVMTVDAVLFFQTALPAASASLQFIVTDPQGQAWLGCPDSRRCRSTSADQLLADVPTIPADAGQWIGPGLAGRLGIGRAAGLLLSAPADTQTGQWRLWLAVSADAILKREDSLLRWLIVTSLAAALSVVAVGVFVLRQQRRAGALEERLLHAEELATARERSDRIIENAPIGVLGVTGDGRVALANPFLERRLGPVKVGATLREAFSAELAESAAWLQRTLVPSHGRLEDAVHLRDVPLAAPGPGEFDMHIVPLHRSGDDVRAFALIEDRSEVRNLERQLIRAEKLLTVGVLSAGIAHEIGTPLAVIRGRTEHVARQLDGGGALEEDLQVVLHQIDAISSTISQVLDFARTTTIDRRPVPLASIIERSRQLLDWRLEARRVAVRVELEPNLPELAADPDQLQQVLVNLMMNATDAGKPGGTIRISGARADSERVRVECIDDGCGVPPEHLHAVFDPFFTTKKRGEGTGLGLSIVASIVRNHGGVVRLASVSGRGTTVTILWPRWPGGSTS